MASIGSGQGRSPGSTVHTPVLIIGRGPVGMTLALRLAGFGVESIIADPLGWDADPGSKALCMQQESLEILRRVGVGEVLGEKGVYWPLGRTYVRGKEVAQVRFPPAPERGFPPFVNFPQRDTEALLLERLRHTPLVTPYLGFHLSRVSQSDHAVTASLSGPEGEVTVTADYIVGCDGARSAVRKQLGFAFSGTSYTANFLLCDIRAKLDFPNERRLHFDPPFNRGRTVLIHPCPDDVWHIDWQVGPDSIDVEAERANGGVERRVRAITGSAPYELLWLTTYTFRSLIADRMRIGRAFLAGDAAHLFAPYGARGLNSGLADAEALAWRLAARIRDRAGDALLDEYDRERMAAARENFAITDTTARFMAPPTLAARLAQDAILQASRFSSRAARRINAGRFYQPAALPRPRGHPLEGLPLPDAACVIEGRPGRLRDLVGPGILLLVAGRRANELAAACAKAASSAPGTLRPAVVVIGSQQQEYPGRARTVIAHPAAAQIYRAGLDADAGRIILVRPDAYVAAVGDFGKDEIGTAPDAIAGALRRMLFMADSKKHGEYADVQSH